MPFLVPAISAVVGAIGSALGAIGSFTIGGLAIGKTLITIGLNVAAALIQKALTKKQEATPGGVQFERQYGGDVPRQVACGLVGIAGHDCYVNTFGSSNKFLQQVYTLSDYPSDGLSRVSINGNWVTLGAVDADKGAVVTSGEFANLIWVKFLDGRQTTANSYLVANANPSARWTSAHKGIGQTAVLVSMTYDREKNNQFPDFFFEFRGARLYDWRKDSSVGGTGSHRWNDTATHEFSENPILIEYNYRRGFSVNGDLFCGMDMPAGDLPLDKWTSAANLCDETVEGEKRYRCSIMLDCMSTHGTNIESIALSCGAMAIDGVDGSWPIVGSDQTVVMTFTDDDLITTARVQYRAKRSMSELVNSVSGSFPNPDELWSMVGYDPQISSAYVTLDRRTRDLSIDFPQVRSGRQAAQLAFIYLYENRYEATATITLRPRFQVLEPGDWVTWESARYGTKTYIVTETSLASLDSDGPRNVTVSLQERDGEIYDSVTPPTIVLPTPAGTPSYLGEVQDFALVAVSISGADGRLAPAIRASWSSIQDETVTSVDVSYYPTAEPSSVIHKVVPVGTTVALLAEGVISSTEYTVKTKLITDPARTTATSAGATVTTGSATTDLDVYLNNIKGDAYEVIQQAYSRMDEIEQRMELIAAGAADATGSNVELHTVAKRFQNATAVAMSELTANIETKAQVFRQPDEPTANADGDVWIDTDDDNFIRIWSTASGEWEDAGAKGLATFSQDDEPTGKNIGDLWVDTNDDNKLYRFDGTDWIEVSDDRIAANASAITALQATVGDEGAGVLWRMTTQAGSGDVVARVVLQVRATVGGAWITAGTIWEAGFVGGSPSSPFSRMVANASQFIVTDGTNNALPLVFESGVLKLAIANIGTVTAGLIKSPDDKFKITLASGKLEWFD